MVLSILGKNRITMTQMKTIQNITILGMFSRGFALEFEAFFSGYPSWKTSKMQKLPRTMRCGACWGAWTSQNIVVWQCHAPGCMRHFLGAHGWVKGAENSIFVRSLYVLPCYLGTEFSEPVFSAKTFLSSTGRHYLASINPREVLIFRITRFINKKTYKTYIDVGFRRE